MNHSHQFRVRGIKLNADRLRPAEVVLYRDTNEEAMALERSLHREGYEVEFYQPMEVGK